MRFSPISFNSIDDQINTIVTRNYSDLEMEMEVAEEGKMRRKCLNKRLNKHMHTHTK